VRNDWKTSAWRVLLMYRGGRCRICCARD
jgi:hypothetical protein